MKPLLYQVNAFDASYKHEFEFIWTGNQSFGNICIIRNNETNEIVYQQSQTTMQLKHVVEGNILSNGKLYNISIANLDSEGNISEYSNAILFYCYTTPTFNFDNFKINQIVKNSTYQLQLNYFQPEGEQLQSYEIALYDTNKAKIQSSNIRYDMSNMSFVLSGLEDNHSYFIKAVGETLNGMEIQTEFIPFTVNYIQPAIYSIITLENVEKNGYIKIQSNVKSIECYTQKPPTYIDNDYIDLRDNILTMDKDFSLNNDFVINLCGYGLSHELIMQLFGERTNVSIFYRKGKYEINDDIEKVYVELLTEVGTFKYRTISNYIPLPSSSDKISIWIIRKNGLYSVDLQGKKV